MEKNVDILIIGAGILGCFAARNCSRYDLDVAVLEKEEDVCTGISKANTGIIYPGFDQPPGSLKAELCVKASKHFPRLCEELDVAYRRCGLLVLSFGPNADEVLKKKLRQSEKNGVENVRVLSADEVYAMEPGLRSGVSHALYAENACVVNPWELGIAAYENARKNGVSFYFKENVRAVKRLEEGFAVETDGSVFHAKRVLICAGFYSDTLWESVSAPAVRLIPKKGEYLVLDTTAGGSIRHAISVEAEEKGEGLKMIPTVNGNILIGPTKRRSSDEPDSATTEQGLAELVHKCKETVPSMPMDRIIRNFGTARPNPFPVDENGNVSDENLKDFVILEENGLFGLIGVKTPGITCANELGNYMSEKIAASFEEIPKRNPAFDPYRKGIVRSAALSDEELQEKCMEDPDYATVICRCRQVSKAEVLEAIDRGATTLDGIKRRTGAGMGRCQGGFCAEKILHILSETLNKNIYSVTKDGEGSEIIRSRE